MKKKSKDEITNHKIVTITQHCWNRSRYSFCNPTNVSGWMLLFTSANSGFSSNLQVSLSVDPCWIFNSNLTKRVFRYITCRHGGYTLYFQTLLQRTKEILIRVNISRRVLFFINLMNRKFKKHFIFLFRNSANST